MSRHLKRNRKIPVDVMGIVLQVGELGTIQRKSDGSSVYKRDVQICDMSNHKVLELFKKFRARLLLGVDFVVVLVGGLSDCSYAVG